MNPMKWQKLMEPGGKQAIIRPKTRVAQGEGWKQKRVQFYGKSVENGAVFADRFFLSGKNRKENKFYE